MKNTHAFTATYEVLYFDGNGDRVEKLWGRDIRSGYGITLDDACGRNWFERNGRNKVVVLESEKISMERYNQLLDFDESKLAEIEGHHRMGIE